MTIQDWNPFLRFARQRDSTLLQGLLQATDHRLLYFHSGSGYVEATEQLYPIGPGTVIYMPAGTAYRYLFDGEPPVFSGFNFDFFQNFRSQSAPIPPVFYKDFSRDQLLEAAALEQGDIPTRCICLAKAFSLEEAFLETAEEYLSHNLYYEARCSALLKDILIRMIRREQPLTWAATGRKRILFSNISAAITAAL